MHSNNRNNTKYVFNIVREQIVIDGYTEFTGVFAAYFVNPLCSATDLKRHHNSTVHTTAALVSSKGAKIISLRSNSGSHSQESSAEQQLKVNSN